MRILVTGGAGYIGSHTAKLLAAAGHEPVIFDDLSQGHEWAVKWGPLERGSLSDPERLAEVFARRKIDAVVHFAANALVGESMTNPAKYFQNNTVGTLNLLNAMREAGVGTIVFSSTCATYGDPIRVPIDETHPQSPVNPYGESKLMVEKILRWYGDSYGLRWMALRYFNAAGADPDGEIGEDHDPESHLIPLVIGAALGTRPPVKIFGTDYPTPDGTAVRDYVHVMDLADAHLRAIERLRTGHPEPGDQPWHGPRPLRQRGHRYCGPRRRQDACRPSSPRAGPATRRNSSRRPLARATCSAGPAGTPTSRPSSDTHGRGTKAQVGPRLPIRAKIALRPSRLSAHE